MKLGQKWINRIGNAVSIEYVYTGNDKLPITCYDLKNDFSYVVDSNGKYRGEFWDDGYDLIEIITRETHPEYWL